MSTPDVRVRLSPEGMQEIIFALRQLQGEAKKANKGAADGVNVVKSAVQELKGLLPTLGLAAVVGGFLALSKQAVNTADQMGKIQQKVGGAVEDISALNLAFRTNESDQAGMQTALLKTAQVMGQVRAGSTEVKKALGAIGVDADALTKLDTPRALEAIARGLQKIPPGGDRAAAALKIFGKGAGDLIVALDAVGEQGIDQFIEKAREMGVLIDEDLARAAARANDSLGLIRIQAEGLATQFVAGLAPAVADAMETFNDAITGGGINGMRTFGEVIGFVIRLVIALFVGMGKEIGAAIAKVGTFVESVGDASKAIARGDLDGALESFREGARRRLAIEADLQADLAKLGQGLRDGPSKGEPRKPKPDGQVDTGIADDQKKADAALLAARRQALSDQLKITQERIKSEEQANKRAYDQELISLDEYYGKRHELIIRAADAELAALKAQRNALANNLAKATGDEETEAERIKLRQELASINAQITAREISAQRELAELAADEIEAQQRLSDERLKVANTLDELENRRHEVFQRNLAKEIESIRELGARAGQTAEEIEATVQRLSAARGAQFNFDEATRKGEEALKNFERVARLIRQDQEAGIISQVEGEMRLINLQKERLGVLQGLAQELQVAADATGSQELIDRAVAYADAIREIGLSYQQATNFANQFKTGGVEAFGEGVESLLNNVEDIESIGDVFKTLAMTVADALRQIAAEIIKQQIQLALIKAFLGGVSGGAGGGGSSAAAAAAAGVSQYGGRIRGYSKGGDVWGKRLPIKGPDNIPILAMEGEFMMRRARVQEPGALEFLRAWNSGRLTLAQAMRLPRYATGGQIGAAPTPVGGSGSGGGDGSERFRIVNVLDPELVNQALASSSGEKTMMNVIKRNSSNIKRMLGS